MINVARLSFALSASKIKAKARVVAMDLRGHGKSSTNNDLDLSIEVWIFYLNEIGKGYAWLFWLTFILMLLHFFSPFEIHPVFSCFMLAIFFSISSIELTNSLSMQTLCDDVVAILKIINGDSPPAIILVGHRFFIRSQCC